VSNNFDFLIDEVRTWNLNKYSRPVLRTIEKKRETRANLGSLSIPSQNNKSKLLSFHGLFID
jgi:hypothetical protein